MELGNQLGFAGVVLTLLGIAAAVLIPNKRWVGSLSFALGVLIIVLWGYLVFVKPDKPGTVSVFMGKTEVDWRGTDDPIGAREPIRLEMRNANTDPNQPISLYSISPAKPFPWNPQFIANDTQSVLLNVFLRTTSIVPLEDAEMRIITDAPIIGDSVVGDYTAENQNVRVNFPYRIPLVKPYALSNQEPTIGFRIATLGRITNVEMIAVVKGKNMNQQVLVGRIMFIKPAMAMSEP